MKDFVGNGRVLFLCNRMMLQATDAGARMCQDAIFVVFYFV